MYYINLVIFFVGVFVTMYALVSMSLKVLGVINCITHNRFYNINVTREVCWIPVGSVAILHSLIQLLR